MKLTLSAISALSVMLPVAGLLYVASPSTSVSRHNSPDDIPSTSHASRVIASDSSEIKIYLPNDLEATLWAESPMLYNPTNMDVDAKGRIWVTEAVKFRAFQNKTSGQPDRPDGERIVILEDTNGDGKADDSKVFVTDPDLVAPLGIAVVGNKTIVSCSPNLIVYTDENGDDKPDRKEIMLTGFGGLDHDHGLHALVAGPDGKYYVNVGNAGPHVVSDKDGWTLRSGSLFVGGSPYNKINHGNQVSDDGRVWTGGVTLRINPDGSGLKVMGHNARNSYETALDSYGNLWQSDNDDEVMACRTGWLMEGGNAGYFSNDGTRSWQADKRPGQSVSVAHWHQEDPDIMPAGDLTGAGSPTGMVVYEGDELGAKYRGMLLSADAGRNSVFSYRTDMWGAGYRLARTTLISTFPTTDEDSKVNEPLNDTRKWFRPSDVTVGPDGALYVADWYDPINGAHQTNDAKAYGRIYRITPKGKTLKAPKIDLRTTQGQIAALLNPAVNVRMLGFEALKAQSENAIEPVMTLLTSTNPYHRARAIFLLAYLGSEGQFEVERLLKANDAPMRIAALRALRSITPENSKSNPALTPSQRALLPLLGNLSTDPSAAVRREVAVAVRDIPYADCRFILLNLIKGYDGQDRYYLNALGEAADGKEDALFADLRMTLPADPVEWDAKTASLIWELHPALAAPLVKKRAEAPTLSPAARQQAIVTLGFINSPAAAKAMVDLTKSADREVADQALYWTGFRRGNSWATFLNWNDVMPMPANAAPPAQRSATSRTATKESKATQREAAQRNAAQQDITQRDATQQSVAQREVVQPAIRKPTVAPVEPVRSNPAEVNASPKVSRMMAKQQVLLDGFVTEAERRKVALDMARNAEGGMMLVGLASEEKLSPAIIKAVSATILKNPDSTVRAMASPYFSPKKKQPVVVEKETAKPVETASPTDASGIPAVTGTYSDPAISEVAALSGNAKAGLTVFKANCGTCHRHGQQGNDIGPNLTNSHQKFDKAGLLEAIIYPSRSIASGYEPWLITTTSGQTYYGFLVGDSNQSVIVKGKTGQTHTIPADKVFSRRQYKTSLMPDPASMGMTQQQLADLTAFLLKQ